MRRMLLLCLLAAAPARAQPADCAAVPVGPALPLDMRIGIPGRPGAPSGKARLDLGAIPANGTLCAGAPPPPEDALHGPPAPHGLLRGNGPRDVLHDRREGHVTVQPVQPRSP